MRKRVKLVTSLSVIVFALAMFVVGVYAAVGASVNVGAVVNYSAHDASVLVQGMVQNALNAEGNNVHCEELPEIEGLQGVSELQESDRVVGLQDRYLDFVTGSGINAGEMLAQWKVGDLCFDENSSGVKEIKIVIRITNFSLYPVKIDVTIGGLQSDNVQTRLLIDDAEKESSVVADKNLVTGTSNIAEVLFGISVKNDALAIEKQNFSLTINMSKYLKNEAGGTGSTDASVEYLVYEFNENLTATVIGYTGSGGKLTIPETVENSGKIYTVTTIGANAFVGAEITSVVLPETVTRIENDAFSNRSDLLQTLILSDGLLELDGITTYSQDACNSYAGGLYIPSVTNEYFALVGSTQEIETIHKNCKVIKNLFNLTFAEEIFIPKGVKSIETSFGCNKIIFEENSELKIVGTRSNLFYKQIQNLPLNIEAINCSVDYSLFAANNSSILNVIQYVTSKDNLLIANITQYAISENNTQIANISKYATFENNMQITNINQYSIAENNLQITNIAQYTISDGLLYIGTSENKYLYMVGWTDEAGADDVVVHNGCRLISAKAFAGCSEMNMLTLPSTMQIIQSLPTTTYTLYIYAETPPKFCCVPFSENIETLGEIYVPTESVTLYKQAKTGATINGKRYLGWSDFADNIQAILTE